MNYIPISKHRQLLHEIDEIEQLLTDVVFDVPGSREKFGEAAQSMLDKTDELYGPEYGDKILEFLSALCAKRGPDYFEKIDRIEAELEGMK